MKTSRLILVLIFAIPHQYEKITTQIQILQNEYQ